VQTFSPHTGEPLNPVRAAMERAGLRHVPYGRTKQLSEVRPPLPQHIQESEQKV
jgi:hypothetical protein